MSIILTNHAKSRLSERYLSEDKVWSTVQKPDSVTKGKQTGTLEYVRRFGPATVTAIVKESDSRDQIVLSCWIDPPVYGTKDYQKKERYKAYRKAPWWRKILMEIFGF